MNHNLIPPFILDEAGLEVDTQPKIHSKNLSVDSHSIFGTATEIRIPLNLRGVFSSFNSKSLNSEEIHDCKSYDTIDLTPDCSSWNPTNTSWDDQKDSLLDSDGNIPSPLVRESHNLISEDEAEIFHVKFWNKQLMMFCFPLVVGILREAMMMARKNGSLLKMQ